MWADRYVGLPFRAAALGQPGFRCGDLVRKVLAEQFGVVLVDSAPVRGVEAYLARLKANGDWRSVPAPQPGDVLLMTTPVGHGEAAPLHVGIMATPTHVLHVDEGRLSTCDSVASPSIRHRMAGFYRHRCLA